MYVIVMDISNLIYKSTTHLKIEANNIYLKKGCEKMKEECSLKELIIKSQNGDSQATKQIVAHIQPLINKYACQLGYEEAASDLTLWILESIRNYKPNVILNEQKFDHDIESLLKKFNN